MYIYHQHRLQTFVGENQHALVVDIFEKDFRVLELNHRELTEFYIGKVLLPAKGSLRVLAVIKSISDP
jgi:hypothetical protein